MPRLEGRTRASLSVPTAAEWLETHIADLTGATDRTRADYRSHAARYITPLLSALDVDEVTPSNISRLANQLDQKVSARTVANLRGLLSAAFGYAVEQGHRQGNPMHRLRRSRAGLVEHGPFVVSGELKAGLHPRVERLLYWNRDTFELTGDPAAGAAFDRDARVWRR